MLTAEAIKKANEMITAIPIKEKNYAQVSERVKAFRAVCPGGQILTEIVSLENGIVTMKTTINDEDGRVIATGLAQEKESNGFINKFSFIENCETSAVGRALFFAGIGGDGSVASAEEVANAILNQNRKDAPNVNYPPRNKMMDAIYVKYPRGSKPYEALIAAFGVDDIENASDDQIKAAYNKATKK